MSTTEIGQAFEAQAVAELLSLGWSILDRNFRASDGELDIVAWKAGTLWFVEVKGSRRYIGPERAITRRKQGRITRAAEAWLEQSELEPSAISFVACAIDPQGVRWIVDAFDAWEK